MKLFAMLLGGLLTLGALTGCGRGAALLSAPVGAPSATAKVAVTLQVPTRRVQSLVSSYTTADIDHVVVQVLRGGTLVSGVSRSIAKASLGSAINLSGLRIGTSYQLQAVAYADAAETTKISIDAGSRSPSFTTPSVTAAANGDTIDETAIATSLPLTLADKVYAGQVSLSVTSTKNTIDQVTVTLYKLNATAPLTTTITTFSYPVTTHPSTRTVTLTNLMISTNYRIDVQPQKLAGGNYSTTSTLQQVTFSTVANASGQVEDRPVLSATSVNLN